MPYSNIATLTTDWTKECEILLADANKRHEGKIRVRKKNETWYWHTFFIVLSALHISLPLIPLLVKCIKEKTFDPIRRMWHFSNYSMTLGRTIWTPPASNGDKDFSLLRHEIAHFDDAFFAEADLQALPLYLKDASALLPETWWRRMLHYVKYLWGTPLPFLVARYRAHVEYSGYLQNLRVHVWNNVGNVTPNMRSFMLNAFTGPGYLWMCTESYGLEIVTLMIHQVQREWKTEMLHFRLFGETRGAEVLKENELVIVSYPEPPPQTL